MRRILSVISGNIESGGVETYLKNAYENIDRSDLEIDILVPGKIIFKPYAEAFQKMGCNLLVMNIPQNNGYRYIKLYKAVNKALRARTYDLVHVNTGNLTIQTLVLKSASKNDVPIRVAHSHGTLYKDGVAKEFIKNWMRMSVNRDATIKLACSKLAAESLFGSRGASDAIIAKNGIRVEDYRYDESTRATVRLENGWDGKYIIGSVGRLALEKNYSFLIKVFARFLRQVSESVLVLVGDGEEKKRLEEESKKYGIQEYVIFMGVRNDRAMLKRGMDVFILASKREALGIVNIEAQASGLPCVVSDVIPSEVNLTGDVTFIPLNSSIDTWVEALLCNKDKQRKDNTEKIKLAGYDLKHAYSIINELYHYNNAVE